MSFLTQGRPTVKNKTYGRKPYIKGDIGDYTEQMGTVTRKAIEDQQEMPRSNFDKPYNSIDYPNQEYIQPPDFNPVFPNIDPFKPDKPSSDPITYPGAETPCCDLKFKLPFECCDSPAHPKREWVYTYGIGLSAFNQLCSTKLLPEQTRGIEERFLRSINVFVNGLRYNRVQYRPDVDPIYPVRVYPPEDPNSPGCFTWRDGDKVHAQLNGPGKGNVLCEGPVFRSKSQVACGSWADSQCCTCDCEAAEQFLFDDANTSDTIVTGSNIEVYVIGGCPPFVFKTSSTGYDFEGIAGNPGYESLEDRHATLNCANTPCEEGTAINCAFTVTDACATVVSGVIRNTEGAWKALDWDYNNVDMGSTPPTEPGDTGTGGYSRNLGTHLGTDGYLYEMFYALSYFGPVQDIDPQCPDSITTLDAACEAGYYCWLFDNWDEDYCSGGAWQQSFPCVTAYLTWYNLVNANDNYFSVVADSAYLWSSMYCWRGVIDDLTGATMWRITSDALRAANKSYRITAMRKWEWWCAAAGSSSPSASASSSPSTSPSSSPSSSPSGSSSSSPETSYVGSVVNDDASNVIWVLPLTGLAADDLMFTLLCVYKTSAATITPPTGWTLDGSYTDNNDKYYLYHRIATVADTGKTGEGEDPDNFYVWSSDATKISATIVAFRDGFNTADPVDAVSNTAYTTTNTTLRAAAMSVTDAGSTLIFFGADYETTTAITSTVPATQDNDWVEDYDAGAASSDFYRHIYHCNWSGEDSTGVIDATLSANQATKHAFAVALNREV